MPAAVGVDIGCGMCAVRTPLSSSALGDNAQDIFDAISAAIPHGRTNNGGAWDRGAWGEPPSDVRVAWEAIRDGYERDVGLPRPQERAPRQLGTLGTGNHFVEVCLDKEDRVWLSCSTPAPAESGRHLLGRALTLFPATTDPENPEESTLATLTVTTL